jgi:hypothetical protein
MPIKIHKEIELKMPRLPNFLRYVDNEDKYIEVADLTALQIEKLPNN